MNTNEPPSADDFYSSPALNFTPRPGEILRRRTVATPGLHRAKRAWQLVYATRTTFAAPLPASAIVITPDSAESAGPPPVLVYCTSFHGLGGRCAPSQLLAGEGSEPESGFIASALERGWTVAVPDGQCLGMRGLGPHAFLAGRAAAHAVLDLARAVRATGSWTRRRRDARCGVTPMAAVRRYGPPNNNRGMHQSWICAESPRVPSS